MNPFSFIKQKVSILDVVNQYATLKKAGLYWKGLCPFHHERTPSFSVSPDKGIFYCFGCHMGGDVISFISKIENCSALEAIHHIAEQHKIILPNEEQFKQLKNNHDEKDRYFNICAIVAKWCYAHFLNNKLAYEYILSRGINNKNIKDFAIGYFPTGQAAIKHLLNFTQKYGILAQDLIGAKILIDSKNGLYSPFEDRIIFPIKDHLGREIGFGARIFKTHDERHKYYNSHDHLFFNKGSLLFGLDRAKKKIQEKEAVFLVEGYLDLIAMVQHGFDNSVATLGTACTSEHLKLLARYANKIYIVYDSDSAGQKAIMRLVELCWQVSLDLHVIVLPDKEDPASFLFNKGDLNSYINQAQDIFIFFINYLTQDFSNKSLQERITITKKVIEIIGQLEDPIKQDILLKNASETFDIPFNTLKQQLNKNFSKTLNKTRDFNNPQDIKDNISNARDRSRHNFNTDQANKNLIKNKDQNEEKAICKITQLEKKLFYAIILNKQVLSSEDKELLELWLPEKMVNLLDKILIIDQEEFNKLSEEEKKLISRLVIEAENNGPDLSFEQLLLQFYKKCWKIFVHNVKLEIVQAQKQLNNEQVKKLLSSLEALKKKMLQRGIS